MGRPPPPAAVSAGPIGRISRYSTFYFVWPKKFSILFYRNFNTNMNCVGADSEHVPGIQRRDGRSGPDGQYGGLLQGAIQNQKMVVSILHLEHQVCTFIFKNYS
jgi:hypothetical protein